MKITINGQMQSFDGGLNVADVLERQGYAGMLVAVARNGEFVAKADYGAVELADGDDLEIVAPMQGG
jgi:sulfur carrier protein